MDCYPTFLPNPLPLSGHEHFVPLHHHAIEQYDAQFNSIVLHRSGVPANKMNNTELIDERFCIRGHGQVRDTVSAFKEGEWVERCPDCFLDELLTQGGDFGGAETDKPHNPTTVEECLDPPLGRQAMAGLPS